MSSDGLHGGLARGRGEGNASDVGDFSCRVCGVIGAQLPEEHHRIGRYGQRTIAETGGGPIINVVRETPHSA